MDKVILKKFAIESRKDLMDKVRNKIKTFYVDEEFDSEQKGEIYVLSNEKHSLSLTNEEYQKRELLIKRIKELSLEQVIEESAYTWFNRIIAIRYMEINDYLPLTKDNHSLGIRVLSSKDNTPDPEILKFTNLINPDLDIDFKKEKYVELKDDNEKFKYVLLLVCKKLGRAIPQVFDGITDYIDILIPDNLLNDTGFITKVINEVPEENYNQVEIIGWLYQYYNQTEKDRVISAKKAYKKNEIPYATQLFTPDWIVKYMVENSLGRYWIEHNGDGALYPSDNLYPSNNLYPSSSITSNWKYFIKDNIENKEDKLNPTEITFIDPCCGSGHILVYAFEVFYQIYLESGFNKNDIPELILKNNLYGLDIDDRAGQLSILSVLLKAREYDKNIFNKEIVKNLNIMSIQESNTISEISIDNITTNNIKEQAKYLIDNFRNAKEIGSLLILENYDYSDLEEYINNDETIFGIELKEKLIPIIIIAKILAQKYDIVVTNPPYMNRNVMGENLKAYISKKYNDVKTDLFSSFIIKNSLLGNNSSYLGMMTPFVWMFISSYEKLRKNIIDNLNINSLIQFEYSSFDEATVPICTFVLNNHNDNSDGVFFRLTNFKGGMEKQKEMFLNAINKTRLDYTFRISCKKFENISGYQIAYWISDNMFKIFKDFKKLSDIGSPRQGLSTTNNNKFVRNWYEVSKNNIKRFSKDKEEAKISKKRWFPYNNGGEFRKWYGNELCVVNWWNDGYDIKEYIKDKNPNVARGEVNYFYKCISWNLISSSNFGVRCYPQGMIFDVAAHSLFCNDKYYYYLAGLLNSVVVRKIVDVLNPTLNMSSGVIANIPIPISKNNTKEIEDIVKSNIKISKLEWDSFETSWDFKKHPLLEFIDSMPGMHDTNIKVAPTHLKIVKNNFGEDCFIADEIPMKSKIYDSFRRWEEYTEKQFNKLKENEEKLNEIFIDIYGLKDELTPEVDDKDITIRKADKEREIKSLISYAVGCMFGRYSLDKEGLIYAGGDFDEIYKKHKKNDGGWTGVSLANYKVLNDNGQEIDLSFEVDNDNVIPITDEAYFSDDIVERFKTFISVVYGEKTLNENLDFIAETLGKKGTETSEDTIRRYFVNDFFNDHVKTYQKRPIYWLFDSGKKNGFKALVYMHRYNENLIPKVRLDYLHRMQTTYEKLLVDVNDKLTSELSMTDKKETQKRQADLNAKLQEIREYDEKIAHIANQRISIDLDDGVKANYDKFKDILAKIK